MQVNRNGDILRHIVRYCGEINETVARFGANREIFMSDSIYRNAIALCVLQIGELTGHLSPEFKEKYPGMPWNQIRALRNVVAHNYGKIDAETLWETVESDIPELLSYCSDILDAYEVLVQDCIPEENEQQGMKMQ